MTFTETAFAKINLALHVRARRDDGYHELETLFAFVDQGDRLTAKLAEADNLTMSGEFGGQLTDSFDNIVSKALGVLPRSAGLEIAMEKNLPVAAGLGGGSADAGAVFRMLRDIHGLPDDWQQRAARLAVAHTRLQPGASGRPRSGEAPEGPLCSDGGRRRPLAPEIKCSAV